MGNSVVAGGLEARNNKLIRSLRINEDTDKDICYMCTYIFLTCTMRTIINNT